MSHVKIATRGLYFPLLPSLLLQGKLVIAYENCRSRLGVLIDLLYHLSESHQTVASVVHNVAYERELSMLPIRPTMAGLH